MAMFLFSGAIWSLVFWFLFSAVGMCALTYYLVYYRQTKRWEQSNIPFLQPTFLIGHKYFLQAFKYSISVPLEQIYKENSDKDLVGIFMGMLPVILVRNPNLFRTVFAQKFGPTKSSWFDWILRESGVVMSFVEADQLVQNVSKPLFFPQWYQGPRFEVLKKEIREMQHTAESANLNGSPVNATELTYEVFRNIASSTFGIDRDESEMKKRFYSIVDDFFEPSFFAAFKFLSGFIFPSLQMFDSFKAWSRKTRNTMADIITYQINLRGQTDAEPRDFIDCLQSFRTKEESKKMQDKDSDVSVISREVLAKMTAAGIVALTTGSEGAEKLFLFTIHALSLHPEYQRKIRSEVREALKKHGVAELNYDVVRSLTFLTYCVKETARLYTVSFMVAKECPEDFQIPGTKYILRKGDKVLLPYYSGNRDERNFKDPDSFYPERFMSKDKDVPEILLSFSSGSTKCPGYTHALFVISALVASLVQKYEIKPHSHFKLMDSTDLLPKGFILQPRKNLLVDLVPSDNTDDS